MAARPRGWDLGGEFRVDAAFWVSDRRRRDIDNLLKLVLDALNKGVAWHDDFQVVEIHATRQSDLEHPRTEVTVGRLGEL